MSEFDLFRQWRDDRYGYSSQQDFSEVDQFEAWQARADIAEQRIRELEEALRINDTCARHCEGAAYRTEAKRLRALNAELIAAAQAVIDRWDSPAWKDLPPTRDAIARLRAALETPR